MYKKINKKVLKTLENIEQYGEANIFYLPPRMCKGYEPYPIGDTLKIRTGNGWVELQLNYSLCFHFFDEYRVELYHPSSTSPQYTTKIPFDLGEKLMRQYRTGYKKAEKKKTKSLINEVLTGSIQENASTES